MAYVPKYDLSQKNVLIVDTSSNVELAVLLAKSFGKVYYFCEWKKWGYPDAYAYYVGTGIKGVERIYYLWKVIDEKKQDGTPLIDLVVFIDCYDADVQKHIESLGIACYGPGWGTELELDRMMFKKILKDVGLPVSPFKETKGLEELRTYLKEHKDIWYKVSNLRGITESDHSENYKLVEPKLDDLQNELSILADEINFICEDSITSKNCVEIAMDLWTMDGQFPKVCGGGFEIKNTIYLSVCRPYDEFPKQLRDVNDKLSPSLKGYKYKGAFGTEVRTTDDMLGYCNDFTARFSFPNSFLQMWHWVNYADILWGTAHGEVIDAIPRGRFGIEYIFKSDFATTHYMPVYVDPQFRDQVKIMNLRQKGEILYAIPVLPGSSQIGSCVAVGDTIEEAVKNVKEVAKSVEGIGIDFPMGALDKDMFEDIEKLNNLGLNFFDLKRVEPEIVPEPPKEEVKKVPVKKSTRSVSGFLSMINK